MKPVARLYQDKYGLDVEALFDILELVPSGFIGEGDFDEHGVTALVAPIDSLTCHEISGRLEDWRNDLDGISKLNREAMVDMVKFLDIALGEHESEGFAIPFIAVSQEVEE